MSAIIVENGIELTGTLYTSAGGDAENKLALAQQIYDTEAGEFQSELNKKTTAIASIDDATIESICK